MLCDHYRRYTICRVILIAALGLALPCSHAPRALAHSDHSTLVVRPAFLPVPYSVNESADPGSFKPAPPNVVLHEYVGLPGWVKAPEFEALRQWLAAQDFVIVRAVAPEPGVTLPRLTFHGTVRQLNQAFHVTVMENPRGFPWCHAVFTNLMMPARFAPRGENYIEGYSLGSETGSGLSSTCR
jgi:hypothetical protein